MRRFLSFLVAVAVAAALVSPVFAQPSIFGPGGTIYVTTSSATLSNSVASMSLFSYQVPAGLAQGNYAPLHLRLLGVITTAQGVGSTGALNIGCSYGGSSTSASIALANALVLPGSLVRSPWKLDLWLNGYTGAAASTSITGALQGRLAVAMPVGVAGTSYPAGLATEAVVNAQVDSSMTQGVNQVLSCEARWGSAATTNALTVINGVIVQGN